MGANPERELRDAVEVRIGLIGCPKLRRLVRHFFNEEWSSDAYFFSPHPSRKADHGLAMVAVATARIAGTAAGSMDSVDRNLVTVASLLKPLEYLDLQEGEAPSALLALRLMNMGNQLGDLPTAYKVLDLIEKARSHDVRQTSDSLVLRHSEAMARKVLKLEEAAHFA